MIKIANIVGARPQFVKLAAISKELKKYSSRMKEIIIHTGQHFDINMSDVFFKQLFIPSPQYYLGIHSGNHGAMTGKIMIALEKVLEKEKPDVACVFGDTNSTLAAALTAAKMSIPVAHIEAGLRSYDMLMPEEINRVATDHISRFLFCPTKTSVMNLRKENIYNGNPNGQHVYQTGDVMYDIFIAAQKLTIDTIYKRFGVRPKNFILATLHRAGNTDDPMLLQENIRLLDFVSKKYLPVLIPLHPRTKQRLGHKNIPSSIIAIPPVSYLELLTLLKECAYVITDSGGIQKEAAWSRKVCITLRDVTEWTETVDCGVNFLVGTSINKIKRVLWKSTSFKFPDRAYRALSKEYGDGCAAAKIVRILRIRTAGEKK